MEQVTIDQFIALSAYCPVLDVRSPGEYMHAHLPGAYNLPLFTDDERKVIGTLYKQEGRQLAIKMGLDYFGPNMRAMVEATETIVNNHVAAQGQYTDSSNSADKRPVLVHCWRGGMRSAGVAWLLDLYGFKVYTLIGGYKSFRGWVMQQFEKPYPFNIIGGYTGTGKTKVLKALLDKGHAVVDLEGIAGHKGSAFGGIGEKKQPTQEMFDNLLALKLHRISSNLDDKKRIWLEDESRRIGLVNLPENLWKTMRQSPVYFLDVPFETRLDNIVAEYGQLNKTELTDAIMRIQKRLGSLNAKNAINYLAEDNYKESFRILLQYYDKHYSKGLKEREHFDELVKQISIGAEEQQGDAEQALREACVGGGLTPRPLQR
jgi:tRNA 2-selenouridine synthase